MKSLALGCIAIFIGSYIVPEPNKIIWTYLESGRYFILAIVLLFELTAILTVYFALKTAIRQQHDPDISIENSINKYFGEGTIATLLSFEVRMWSYALLASKVQTTHFIGEHYFSYHEKDGAQSNLLGFALLIAFEMPLMHLLIHFTYSPLAANIITFLTLFSLVFFIAEYRAVSRRPISLAKNKLIIRYGLFQPLTLDLSNIATVAYHKEFVKRSRLVKRYNYAGNPNIVIALKEPLGTVKHIFIGIDKPEQFIAIIQAAKNR